jgi:aerobic-type carbon monoxide dehydrogenase small subunit (CoxS/CutS family)
MRDIMIIVNGVGVPRRVEVRLTLADFLRVEAGLTGTHLGCEHGVCGACTVLVDGLTARACLMLAVQAHEHEVMTVEGLAARPDDFNPLQHAFSDHHALQCGYCTPGILMSLSELLAANPDPSEQDVRSMLSGHLCRCTGYQAIVGACLLAAKMLGEARSIGEGRPK